MAEWVPADGQPWTVAMQRVTNQRVAPEQVQVAWIKLANKGPRGDLAEQRPVPHVEHLRGSDPEVGAEQAGRDDGLRGSGTSNGGGEIHRRSF